MVADNQRRGGRAVARPVASTWAGLDVAGSSLRQNFVMQSAVGAVAIALKREILVASGSNDRSLCRSTIVIVA